jgi:hypothetical protein
VVLLGILVTATSMLMHLSLSFPTALSQFSCYLFLPWKNREHTEGLFSCILRDSFLVYTNAINKSGHFKCNVKRLKNYSEIHVEEVLPHSLHIHL